MLSKENVFSTRRVGTQLDLKHQPGNVTFGIFPAVNDIRCYQSIALP